MTSRANGNRTSILARLWLPENDRNIPTSRTRAFLGRHLWLLCVIAVIVGFAAGLLSGLFIFKWNEWNSPSFGAFIAPAALLGWLALQPRQAALLGLLTLLATVGGHFLGAQFNVYEQNPLEYRGWVTIALFLGPLLGYLGHTLRSRRLLVRAICAGVLIAWLCVPFHLGFHGSEYYVENTTTVTRVVDFSMAMLVLWLCRGFIARIAVLVCAALFLYPLAIVSVLNSIFLWRAGGGI